MSSIADHRFFIDPLSTDIQDKAYDSSIPCLSREQVSFPDNASEDRKSVL